MYLINGKAQVFNVATGCRRYPRPSDGLKVLPGRDTPLTAGICF